MKRKIFLYILPIFIVVLACEKVLIRTPKNSQKEILNEVWDLIDKRYSYFDLKGVDWASIKLKYENSVSDGTSDDQLLMVLDSMISELRDGHNVIYAPQLDKGYGYNGYLKFHRSNLDTAKINQLFRDYPPEIFGPFKASKIGTNSYIEYRDFTEQFSASELDAMMEYVSKSSGLIIDIRGNQGGNANLVEWFAGCFTSSPVNAAKKYFKNGTGHNDFLESNLRILPTSNFTYKKPVAILTNRKCYSAATYFVTVMKALPQVTVVGDSTGGGGGIPTSQVLSNGWILDVSGTRLTTNAGFETELGFPPDVPASTNNIAIEDGILQAAIDILP